MNHDSQDSIDILAFAPHPDDAELFCGGLLIKMAAAGHRTAIVDMTAGELSSRGSVEQRAEEAHAASKIMGLSLRENLGFPDGAIGRESVVCTGELSQLQQTVLCIRRLRPALILAPSAADRHPDHCAAHRLITDAVFFAGLWNYLPGRHQPHGPVQLLYYQLRFAFHPTFVTDISGFYQKKSQAIMCYASQLAPLDNAEKDKPRPLIGSPLSLASIAARDSYYGSMIGTSYAEAYLSRSPLALEDPVAHFRLAPERQALLFPEEA